MGAPLHCIFCGTANGPGDRFCRLCRSPLGSLTEPAAPAPVPAHPSSVRSHAAAILIATGMVLVASATAFAARGPLLDLAAHVVPQFVQAPSNVAPPVPAATVAPEHAPTAIPSCGPASEHGQGLARGREVSGCTPAAAPKVHGQPERTAKPAGHPTPKPQGLESAPGRDGTQAQAPAATPAADQQAQAPLATQSPDQQAQAPLSTPSSDQQAQVPSGPQRHGGTAGPASQR